MDSKEIAIQNALKDLNSGKITSLRAAAKQYHVPRSTLQYRYYGTQLRHAAQHLYQ